MRVIIIILVTALIVWIEYKNLKAAENTRTIYLFSFFLLIGIGLNTINIFHIKTPYLLDWLIIVYRPISKLLMN